jgi:pilus assembly protein CpaC
MALVIGACLPGLSLAQSPPQSKPAIQGPVGPAVPPVTHDSSARFTSGPVPTLSAQAPSSPEAAPPADPQPAAAPAPRRRPYDPADHSADDLNRQFNERLQAQMRAEQDAAEVQKRDRGTRSVQLSDRTAETTAPVTGGQVAHLPPPSATIPPAATIPPPVLPPPGQYAQAPAPTPTPIQPPTLITPPAPPPGAVPPPSQPVDEARPRQFGRSAVVPTESPTLSIDAGKGTIIKLKSPASTVFIANPDIADVQVKTGGSIYVFGKKPGETVLYAVDEQDRVLLNTIVLVTHPTGRVLGNVASNVNTAMGSTGIQATTVGGAVVLHGRADNPAAIEMARRMAIGVTGDPTKVINNVALDGPNQVLLKVKIVEAQRESLKRLGINWESVFRLSNSLVAGLATPTDLITNPVTRLANGGAIFGRYTKGGTDIFGLIDLLATENMLTVLAEPNLTAMSGETASFLAGGEFPIVVPQNNGAFAVQFKQFGVSLAFTPTIHGNGRITLRTRPEVSQLSTNGQVNFQGFTIPALTTRRVDTTVELASGQSFAIAGLIQNNSVQDINKLPGLGDIPILGALFRSDSFRRQESELVVIVTPYLVRGVNHQLSTPTQGYVPPNDADRYLFGRTYRAQGAGVRPTRAGARAGGFMLE